MVIVFVDFVSIQAIVVLKGYSPLNFRPQYDLTGMPETQSRTFYHLINIALLELLVYFLNLICWKLNTLSCHLHCHKKHRVRIY